MTHPPITNAVSLTWRDKLYWRSRYMAMFLINLPLIPFYLAWMTVRELAVDLWLCFTTNGETSRQWFWQWPRGGVDD